MAFGGPAEVLELVQAKRPMLAVDEDEIEVELPQNVDHPWGWEGKVVAGRLASGTHGGFDAVGSLQYEAVLTRPEHLAAGGATVDEAEVLLNALCAVCTPVEISFLWRPCCATQMSK
jgi:hypothetical protein